MLATRIPRVEVALPSLMALAESVPVNQELLALWAQTETAALERKKAEALRRQAELEAEKLMARFDKD
ncbi:MAG: hypothetical protein KIT45_05040 [Fimbriimonadia bacterium]|nr:hypothetical protein [Fimbriimonadia bacterium]